MRLARIRTIPWLVLFEALMLARERWSRLEPHERARLAQIVRESGGRPNRVGPEQRREVRELAAKLDLAGVLRDLAPMGRRLRRRR